MREEFLKNEFKECGAVNKDYITINEFKTKYGLKIIRDSDIVNTHLNNLEIERETGVSDGNINFETFSYIYMFLDFGDGRKYKKKLKKV